MGWGEVAKYEYTLDIYQAQQHLLMYFPEHCYHVFAAPRYFIIPDHLLCFHKHITTGIEWLIHLNQCIPTQDVDTNPDLQIIILMLLRFSHRYLQDEPMFWPLLI